MNKSAELKERVRAAVDARREQLIEIADTIHLHPTLSEAVMEAALHGNGRAIHALNL